MTTDLKSRLRAARTRAAGEEPVQHDRAPEAPAELGSVKGHEDVITPMSKTVMAWLERYSSEFGEALPAHVDQGVFFAAVRAILPDLAKCTPASTLQALLTCARFGLIPDGTQAVIKREGTLAVFVPMYQGYIEQMYRSGLVDSVHVGVIHQADEWTFTPTALAPDDFVHGPRPELPQEDRGPVILAYAFAWLKGGARSQVILLSREDAEEIRDEYSEAYRRAVEAGSDDSFWHTHFTDMWKKSCVRRLVKVVPTSADLRCLGDADDAGEAGRVQILAAPDREAALLLAEADVAAKAAEASQEPVSALLDRKRAAARRRADKRSRGKKQRGGTKAGA